MQSQRIPHILPFLRAEECKYKETYRNNYLRLPRPTYNFLIMQEGEAHIKTDANQEIIAKKDDVLWIPKNSMYYVEWIGTPVVFSIVHFDFSTNYDPFLNKKSDIQHLPFENTQALLADFDYLMNKTFSSSNPYFILSVFYRIFGELYPLIQSQTTSKEFHVIQPAVHYIETHYTEQIPVNTLAELCALSTSRFQHLFKEIIGFSPITYKNIILTQHIQQALISNPNIAIEELSEKYGFSSTVYFCKLFKAITGTTPTQYRKNTSLV